MKPEDVDKITKAMRVIQDVLAKYPYTDETGISVDITRGRYEYAGIDMSNTPDEENNFFISSLEDLIETGIQLQMRSYPDETYPWEVFGFMNGIEIHCVCDDETVRKYLKPTL